MTEFNRRDTDKRRRRRGPRPRSTYIWIVGLIVIALSLLTDPDSGFISQLPWGAGTVATVIVLSRGVLYCMLLHYTRKSLFDYVKMEEIWDRTKDTPIAAALFGVAISVYVMGFALAIYASQAK